MNVKVIDDDVAQNDFGYTEIKQYQIFVKKSVFNQLLKQEMKQPKNWLKMGYQVSNLIIKIIFESVLYGFFAAFLLTLFAFVTQDRGSISEIGEMVTLVTMVKLFLILFSQLFFVMMIYVILIKRRKQIKGEIYDNAFTEKISQSLTQQVIALEEKKNRKE